MARIPRLLEGQALMCILPGLGDALVASPLMRGFGITGTWQVDALTMLPAVTEYARALTVFRDVFELPLLSQPRAAAGPLWRLRMRRYDIVVVPFPAARWQYAAIARLIATKRLAMHDYGGISRVLIGGCQPPPVPLRGGHRAAENKRLAQALGLPIFDDFRYVVPESWRAHRRQAVLGMHTGTMQYKGNELRRWAFENFAELARRQTGKGRIVRAFVGPYEREDAEHLQKQVHSSLLEVIQEPLEDAARRLSECEVFIGNDSGMAHLAAGLGVKTIALFGMTNPIRAVPIGWSRALRPSNDPPCHDEGLKGFDCISGFDINRDLTVDIACAAVDDAFEHGLPWTTVTQTGGARLYGRPV